MRERLGEVGLLSDDNRRVAAFEQRGRVYRGENDQRKRLLRYEVDGKWSISGRCCDYALGIPGASLLYLIELKGKDLRSAAEQIHSTLLGIKDKVVNYEVHARVVLSRVQQPDLRSTHVVRLERELLGYNGSFKRQSLQMTEKV